MSKEQRHHFQSKAWFIKVYGTIYDIVYCIVHGKVFLYNLQNGLCHVLQDGLCHCLWHGLLHSQWLSEVFLYVLFTGESVSWFT